MVEACPTVVTGSPSINLLVEPTGTVRVLSTHEQMFSPAYRFIGASFPQSSVPHSALAQVGAALGEASSPCRKLLRFAVPPLRSP